MTDRFPRRFRMKVWPWLAFGWVAANVVVVGLLGAGLALNPGPRPPAWVYVTGFAAGWAVGLPLLALGMGLYVWWCRVRVGPRGLRGYDFWSLPLVVPWGDVVRLEPFSLAGLPFLLVSGHGHNRRLWLPLFLADYGGFVEAVSEEAGGDHPLAVALRERLADD